jgi:hypothetical protein
MHGVAAGDYDRDGWTDLFVTPGSVGVNLLFRNLGDGTFEEVGAAAGVATGPASDAGCAFADLDGDGWLDLWVGGIDTPIKVFRNLGGAPGLVTFEDVSAGTGLPTFELAAGPAFADVDGDGDLDVFVPQWNAAPAEVLWRNDGGFTFSPATEAMLGGGGEHLLYTFTPNFTDLDGDGHLDLVVASDFGNSQVFLANGDGTFRRTTDAAVIVDENGMGATIGDYDRDGHLDWFVTSISGGLKIYGNRLYRGRGNGTFEDVTDTAGVADGGWGWGTCFADFNNDGFLDLFQVNGYPTLSWETDRLRFFVARGDGTFSEAAAARGLSDIRQGRGVVCFDMDRDGDLDVFVTNHGTAPALWRNEGGNGGAYLTVRPWGLLPNIEGIGARIEVTTLSGVVLVQEIRAGSHYNSQSPAMAHFGLGSDGWVERLVVRWPDGRLSRRSRTLANQEILLDQSLISEDSFEAGDLSAWRVPQP